MEPAPAGLLGLPAVLRNSVASLLQLRGVDMLQDIVALDVIKQDGMRPMSRIKEDADGGSSSTESEDELGRTVMAVIAERHGRQL